MGFFVKSKNKRPPPTKTSAPKNSKKLKKSKLTVNEEEISSDEEQFNDRKNAEYKEVSEDEYEDVQSKAYREAKELLEKVKADEAIETDDEDDQAIAHRLIRDAQEKRGFLQHAVADNLSIEEDKTLIYKPHRFSTVAVAVSQDGRYIVSCAKDGSVVKYDLVENKKVGLIKHSKDHRHDHRGTILAIAISPDNKYLVTGGVDKMIKIWKFDTFEFFKNLGSHRAAVTSLVFRQSSVLELYSGSADRTIKAWNLDQMGFVDVMYGHQDGICQLDMMSKERVLSCGGQDRTLRLFKIAEESQLVFNGPGNCMSIDTAAFINEENFVSGAANGSLSLWSSKKRKPLSTLDLAHGKDPKTNESRWITAVAAAHNTDLIVSGSSDGFLRFFKAAPDFKSLSLVKEYKLEGFINGIRFFDEGKKLVCAVGQEHKNGRWWKVSEAKNSVVILSLNF